MDDCRADRTLPAGGAGAVHSGQDGRGGSRSRAPISWNGWGDTAATLNAGFHILIPFLDVIRYRHSLKEVAIDIAEQICITRDNVQVSVDGVLYLKVLNAERASYGITNFVFAISQLAQTTLRSEVGKIELDRTFEERTNINTAVVSELDKASDPWGVKVLRYEIKNIKPPRDVLDAMEKQMRAEREKRAVILNSEGIRDAAINEAEGRKQEVIKNSEGKRTQQINEAEGEAARHSQRGRRHRRRDRQGGRSHSEPRRRSGPPTAGGPSSTSPSSASWPRKETASSCRRR